MKQLSGKDSLLHFFETSSHLQDMLKTAYMIFLMSVSGSKTAERLVLPRMNCTVSKDDFPIARYRRYQLSVRICFAMTISKAQGQKMPGIFGIDLHDQLYVALSRTTNPRNIFVLTTNGFNRIKNDVFSELFRMFHNIHTVRKSFVPKNLTPKLGEYSRIPILNLLNPKNGSLVAVPSPYDGLNVVRPSEDITSISDADSTVFTLVIDQGFITENPSISEFQYLYGLIPYRISCGTILFNKRDTETATTPE